MRKAIVKKILDTAVLMIRQLILTEKLRVSQLNRLGGLLNKLREEINKCDEK